MIHGIKNNPSMASKMKIDHFSQIGVTEVFLESTPTAFVMTVIWISTQSRGTTSSGTLRTLLLGYNYSNYPVFLLTYVTSILSAAFGISRYTHFFSIRAPKSPMFLQAPPVWNLSDDQARGSSRWSVGWTLHPHILLLSDLNCR